jgi:hypothetical protein
MMNDEIFIQISTVFFKKTIECIEPWNKNSELSIEIISDGFKTLFYIYCFNNVDNKSTSDIVKLLEDTMNNYLEFVKQIGDEDNLFLQLTARDATLFTYKNMISNYTNENIVFSTFPSRETYNKIMLFFSMIQNEQNADNDEKWWKETFIEKWTKYITTYSQ